MTGLRKRGIKGIYSLKMIVPLFMKNENSPLFGSFGVIPFIRNPKMGERNGYEDLR